MNSPSNEQLRRRRIFGVGGFLLLIFAIAAVGMDRLGAFGYRGSDVARFDRRSVRAVEVLDGESFIAELTDALDGARERVTVRLLGVDAPDPPHSHWSTESKTYLDARLKDRAVLIRLDGTQSRDASGALLAYVYITDGDLLNADMVRDAQAFADRRVRHTFASSIEQLERDARTKKRGMWKSLRDEDQPAWRQEWLRSLRRR